jgi:hypothetical protein
MSSDSEDDPNGSTQPCGRLSDLSLEERWLEYASFILYFERRAADGRGNVTATRKPSSDHRICVHYIETGEFQCWHRLDARELVQWIVKREEPLREPKDSD